MPKVKLFAVFREVAGVSEVEIEGKNLKEIVEKLVAKYPRLRDQFFDGDKLRDFVQIMINGKHFRGNLGIEVKETDIVAIFPPVSGG
ncbi:MAG: ubiquitin-like small modifier protein 1 [Archaeoglobaceae archaeon]